MARWLRYIGVGDEEAAITQPCSSSYSRSYGAAMLRRRQPHALPSTHRAHYIGIASSVGRPRALRRSKVHQTPPIHLNTSSFGQLLT